MQTVVLIEEEIMERLVLQKLMQMQLIFLLRKNGLMKIMKYGQVIMVKLSLLNKL